ncbi:DUF4214 domain-containing protein [Marinobacter sp.]|uniref:DUF4214 domain-containing protein n=1 Tax=Marinobacter sp. TaxID=50741 RepID=UPI003A92ED49
MAVADQFETVQKLYIAFYQRPADAAGLQYWAEQVEAQGLQNVINAFANSNEATALYGPINGTTIGNVIDQIYSAAFGHPADAGGKAYYIEQFNAGVFTPATIALNVVNGAQNTDATVLGNKVAASNQFTSLTATGVTYDTNDLVAARSILAAVTSAIPSQSELTSQINAQIASSNEQVGGGTLVGSTYSLTAAGGESAGVDHISGTAGNDTFRALVAESLDDADILDGGAGDDVLFIDADGLANGAAPMIRNIETINNADVAGGDLDLSSVTGVTWINSSVSATYSKAALATVFTATAAETTVTVSYADDLSGGNNTANVAADLDAKGTVTFNFGSSAGGIESVNVHVDPLADTAEGTTTVVLDAGLDALKAIKVTGAGVVDSHEATLEVFDASAATGSIETDLDGAGNIDGNSSVARLVVTMGSGNDVVALSGQVDATITLGAGNDTLNLAGTESGARIAGGLGKDTYAFDVGVFANIMDADEAGFVSDIIRIADFDAVNDYLNLPARTQVPVAADAQGTISSQQNLFDAVAWVAGNLADNGGEAAVFQYGRSTYVFAQGADASGFSTGDGLIELTGFTGVLSSSNFDIA